MKISEVGLVTLQACPTPSTLSAVLRVRVDTPKALPYLGLDALRSILITKQYNIVKQRIRLSSCNG
jgi:hypothetical protein